MTIPTEEHGTVAFNLADAGAPDTLSRCIIAAVAALKNCSPVSLPPLYTAVDVDALDRLADGTEDGNLGLVLEYAGTEVTLDQAGTLTVRAARRL